MRKIILFTVGILLLAGCTSESDKSYDGNLLAETENTLEQKEAPELPEPEQVDEDGNVIVNNPHAIDVIVNKDRRLPMDFEPKNLVEPNVKNDHSTKKLMRKEAADALEELFAGAEEAGYELYAQSGYRSIDTQRRIYNNNVNTRGQEWADKYSAVPGHSEHHTGLTMDVTIAALAFNLENSFGNTPEGQWVAEHAHEYGFVIRYPEGKSDITGYSYEPWHLRYFGEEMATDIYESGLTVEEYFGLVE
ncbi:D-alanyl-D-alanine carboxypeptidase family protein [Aquisalibacillus elongatus]|uniref:D-alanyl-D-alanine carboxypeptidase n=1 Tax=Aquisalibacillus elongatus TaxID=485577 RepID=A0A3N5AYV3_9BACI|nr:D-alanyl-D-alanine carboxypeptidase family protein [Aquisalibacillus elongatus]RPF50149.1 D-alanyl-D-alanine carboxypeptidase [Aquisalibacillus elongatus]